MIVLPIDSIDIPCRVQPVETVLAAKELGRVPSKLLPGAVLVRCVGGREQVVITKLVAAPGFCRFTEYQMEETEAGLSFTADKPAVVYTLRAGPRCSPIDYRDRQYPGTRWTRVYDNIPSKLVLDLLRLTAADGRQFLRDRIQQYSRQDFISRHPVRNATLFQTDLANCHPHDAPPTASYSACYASGVTHPDLDGIVVYFGVVKGGAVEFARFTHLIH